MITRDRSLRIPLLAGIGLVLATTLAPAAGTTEPLPLPGTLPGAAPGSAPLPPPPPPPPPLEIPPGPPPVTMPATPSVPRALDAAPRPAAPVAPTPAIEIDTTRPAAEAAPAKPAEIPPPAEVAPTPPAAAEAPKPAPETAAPAPEAAAPTPPPAEAAAPKPPAEAAAPSEPAPTPPPAPEEITLTARPVLFVTGRTTWDDAEAKMSSAFATLAKAIEKTGAKGAGAPLVQYIETDGDDVGYKAMLPVAEIPKGALPKGVKSGTSPAGRAWKFRHVGAPDDLEEVYGRIDDWLAQKKLDLKMVVEEYDEDAVASPEDRIVVDVWVFTR